MNRLTSVLGRIVLTALPAFSFAAAIADEKSAGKVSLPADAPHVEYLTSCTTAQDNHCSAYCSAEILEHPGFGLVRAGCVSSIQWFPYYLATYACRCTIAPIGNIASDRDGCYVCQL